MATFGELMTAAQIAALIKTSPETITNWAKKRIIPSIKINQRVIRYNAADVMDALQRCSAKAGGAK